MSNLQPNCCLKFDFQKVDQHAGGKWLIHDTTVIVVILYVISFPNIEWAWLIDSVWWIEVFLCVKYRTNNGILSV